MVFCGLWSEGHRAGLGWVCRDVLVLEMHLGPGLPCTSPGYCASVLLNPGEEERKMMI